MAENNYDLEYTGSMVDRILDTGYDLQNQGYIFRGLASHYTGTPTERTWLIAPTGSTGFGLSSQVPPGSIGICMYNGSSWSAEVLNTLTLDTAPATGSGNGITSGAVKTLAESITNAIGQLEQSVSDRFTSLTLEDTTGSLQTELLSITLKYVFNGETESITSISILAATAEKAGLMSAADKRKLDAFVTNIRSLRIQDTTAQADQGTEITNTLKWTIGGVTEAITAFTLYASTTSKAGLMSAADKTALDTLPSLINAGLIENQSLLSQEKGYGQFCSKPLFSYGRIETDITVSDGFSVQIPIDKTVIHSQILHNVIGIIPKEGKSFGVFVYDNEGNLESWSGLSPNKRTFVAKNVRIQTSLGTGETIDDVASKVDVISITEKSRLDYIEWQGTEKLVFYQGGLIGNGSHGATPNYCHTNILTNVAFVSPSSGYEIAVLCFNQYGNVIHSDSFGWRSDAFNVPDDVFSISINLRRTDLSILYASEVSANAVTVRKNHPILNGLVYQGYTKRNVLGDWGAINQSIYTITPKMSRLHSGLIDNCIAVFANPGYQIAVMCIDELGNVVPDYFGWLDYVLLPKLYTVRFNMRKIDNTDILDKDEVLANIFVYTSTKYLPMKVSILGDSLSTFGTATEEHADPQDNYGGIWTYPRNLCRYPQSDLLTDVDLTWFKRLIDNYAFVLGVNESWRGTTVTDHRNSEIFPPISLQSRINHLGLNGTPDMIFIFAGTNDVGDRVELGELNTEDPSNYTDAQIANLPVHTFADAYRTMLIRVMKTYPTSKIIVMVPDFTIGYYNMQILDPYVDMIKEICDFFGVSIIDIRTAGITPFNKNSYLPDGIHFNRRGTELIYDRVSTFLDADIIN